MRGAGSNRRAFSLLELLVAFSVFAIILVMVLSLTSEVARITTSDTPAFQEARTAFETMNRLLSQALLNTYWDYDNPGTPERYVRASELHYVQGNASLLTGLPDTLGTAVFFQTPLGFTLNGGLKSMPNLLNSVGFYVRYSETDDLPPYLSDIKPATAAYRLWMYLQSTENLRVYSKYNENPQGVSDLSWFRSDIDDPKNNHVIANHAILLLIRAAYRDANGNPVERYLYDSRPAFSGSKQPVEMHQMPPILNITLVVIDEHTADMLRSRGEGRYELLAGIDSNHFTDATLYKEDIARLQKHLNERPIGNIPVNYRIFESSIDVASSKWSL